MAVTSDGTPYVEPGDAISAFPVVSQELAAVIDSLRTMIPAGAIFPYAGKTAPEGYLFCDGKAYNRGDFFDLYNVMAEWAGQWGGFPNGNSALFFVPDLRGRSPIGTGGGGAARNWALGERWGDQQVGLHYHPYGGSDIQHAAAPGHGTAFSQRYEFATGINTNGGAGGNYQPSTGVNFIVWTGTTTAGKPPVQGVELAPVTTRMMIEARLEEVGIGEEEREVLREHLATLQEDTDG